MMCSPVAVRYWVIFCLFIPMFSSSILTCPPCKCTLTKANCSNLDLMEVPQLPVTIRTLDLSNNRLGNLSSRTFRNVSSHIETLKLSHNFINDIDRDTFNDSVNLVNLDLSDNRFSSPTKVFRALAATKLQLLDLSNTSLHFSNFSTLKLLSSVPIRTLNLQDNSLKVLDGSLKNSCPNLQKLILTGNFIRKISFSDVQYKLKELYIDENVLTEVPSFCLKESYTTAALPALRTLSISANLMTSLRHLNHSKLCVQNIETLLMDNNHFFRISENAFTGFPKLRTLSLNMINTKRLIIHQTAFNSTSLQNLTLGTIQKIFTVSDNMFDYCGNLSSLTLAGVSFYKWPLQKMRKLFSSLLKLKHLTLFNSQISLIPTHFLPNVQNLVYLDARKNFLSSWQSVAFKNATALKTLILSYNHITHLNESFLPTFLWKQIEILDLAFNPFDCSCELYWFRKWLNKNSYKVKTYPKVYFCKSPSKYKDRMLSNYNPSYRECHPLPTLTIALISCACVLVFLAVLAVILYRNRWHIKYYIYLLRAKQGYKQIPGDDRFVYDAFVAYNSTDRIWVISKLKEFLEAQHNMKLCLHERDFSAGRLIIDNIIENIQLSRKVILILTDEFAKSQWCQFETLMAQNRFFEQGASSLVLVMLEDVSSRHLNGPLSLLLQSMTYIEWSKDPAGNEMFWGKLLESLQ
ncbi:toll-like receptor 2 [Ylistrum balloti]|uniref:toll-like receptor 2 n=1 Tax=Ylistrum balloti TaxID=509963 RepID=UPI002905861D|nr:toll-like receptor 2 [Ylistrum balloti]